MSEEPEVVAHALDLLVLGDCNPDLVLTGESIERVFGQVERLVDAAELTIGGSGGIIACGAARLGLRTAFAGVVGDNLFGRFMLDTLAERGVDTRGIAVDPTARTGLTVILSRPGDQAILTFPGTISALNADHVPAHLLTGSRHVHVASFYLQSSLARHLPPLFERAHAAGATTSIDPNWDPDEIWDGGLEDLLRSTDVFLPNAEEAMRIAEVDNAKDAGFLAALLNGWSTRWALALGSACGSLSTRAIGGTPAQPTLAEAEQAVAALLTAR